MSFRRWLLLLLWILPTPAFAQWQPNGTPVYTEPTAYPLSVCAVSDGSGGVLVFWNDRRIGRSHIWMQHLDATGVRLWAADGVPILGLNGEMSQPAATSDGHGGAFVTWAVEVDAQFNTDLYAQHVTYGGGQDWGVDGLEVCSAAGAQGGAAIINDGQFSPFFGGPGAVITWVDTRFGSTQRYIYSQALDQYGNKLWTSSGNACSAAGGSYTNVMICSDGIGKFTAPKGTLVMWWDDEGSDLRGQHMTPAGLGDWGGSVPLTQDGHLHVPSRLTTGAPGNMLYAWISFGEAVVLQRAGTAGAWPSEATACAASGSRSGLRLVPDGKFGAIVMWGDSRVSGVQSDIYIQRIDQNGAVRWTSDGVPICVGPGFRSPLGLVSDDAGGAIMTWIDDRDGNYDVYAQRVDSLGVPQWNPGGIPICTAPGFQSSGAFDVSLVKDGSGGAIAVWHDERPGAPGLYAQRILHDGGVVAVGDREPAPFALLAPRPNPMTDQTALTLDLPKSGPVSAAVYSVGGRLVRSLMESHTLSAGRQVLSWDRTDAGGDRVAAGVYYLRVQAAGGSAVRRIAVMP